MPWTAAGERGDPGSSPGGAITDAEVVRRVLGGDGALFEVLMRRYNQRLYRAVRSVLRDEDAVEDAMQGAWISAYRHLRQYAGESAFSTWLTRIALNEALGLLRRERRAAAGLAVARDEDGGAVMAEGPADPEAHAGARELARMVEEAIDALPLAYRTVLVLREVEGLSTEEAARCLGATGEAVKVRLHRARLALKESLYARAGASAGAAFPFMGARCDRMVEAVLAALDLLPGAA